MKITHVIESSGGSADFVLYLVQYLPEHEHTILHSDRTFGNRLDEVKKRFQTTRFIHWKHAQREVRVLSDLKACIDLYKKLRRDAPDAIHVHSSKAGFLGRLVCFFLRKKNVIYTPNGLSYLRQDVSPLKRKIYVLLERIADAFCGRVVGCSESEAEALREKGIKSDAINNGTEISPPPQHITKNEFIIATTGRVTIQKNPSLFNKIAESFQDLPNLTFLWIGGGELEPTLTSKNIKVTGWMDRSQVIETVGKADIYLSTASWEGLPFAVLEAMNMCKPLILSRCVGNIDLVKENYNGHLYDSSEQAIEKIAALMGNRILLQTFGENSRALVETEFDVVKMAREYERVYLSLQRHGK